MNDLQARCATLQALLRQQVADGLALERNAAVAFAVDSAGVCSGPSWSGWQVRPTVSTARGAYFRPRLTVIDYRGWLHDQQKKAADKAVVRAERLRAEAILQGLERPLGPPCHMYLSKPKPRRVTR